MQLQLKFKVKICELFHFGKKIFRTFKRTGKTNQNVKKELSEEIITITDQIKEINDDISSKDIMILGKLFKKFKVDIVEVLAKYKKTW